MPSEYLNRRTILQGAAALAFTAATPAWAQEKSALHVLKDPSCGCCGAWVKVMRIAGFDVSVQETSNASLFAYKLDNGITEDLASCHTGMIGGYVIEGHVPPADVRRLLAERPDAVGLTVPGMPYGAPGMGPEDERDAYDVLLVMRNGSTRIFASYEAA